MGGEQSLSANDQSAKSGLAEGRKGGERMIPVKLVMRRDVQGTPVDTSVKKAAELMQDRGVGSLLIKNGKNAMGILTETDIVQKVVAQGLDPATTPVRDVMSTPLITIQASQSVVDADDLMERHHIRHLVVEDKGKICGVVSVRDILFPLQYLLVFSNVDLQEGSAKISEDVIEGLEIVAKRRQGSL
jgi:CBS domain-containing protein